MSPEDYSFTAHLAVYKGAFNHSFPDLKIGLRPVCSNERLVNWKTADILDEIRVNIPAFFYEQCPSIKYFGEPRIVVNAGTSPDEPIPLIFHNNNDDNTAYRDMEHVEQVVVQFRSVTTGIWHDFTTLDFCKDTDVLKSAIATCCSDKQMSGDDLSRCSNFEPCLDNSKGRFTSEPCVHSRACFAVLNKVQDYQAPNFANLACLEKPSKYAVFHLNVHDLGFNDGEYELRAVVKCRATGTDGTFLFEATSYRRDTNHAATQTRTWTSPLRIPSN